VIKVGLDCKILLPKILETEYVRDFIKEVIGMKDKEVFEGVKYGFGEDCYYRDYRALVKDAVSQWFNQELEEIIKIKELGEHLLDAVLGYFECEITRPEDLPEHYSGGGIQLTFDIDSEVDEVQREVVSEVEELSDEEIDEIVRRIESG